jgi:hypothetical protein
MTADYRKRKLKRQKNQLPYFGHSPKICQRFWFKNICISNICMTESQHFCNIPKLDRLLNEERCVLEQRWQYHPPRTQTHSLQRPDGSGDWLYLPNIQKLHLLYPKYPKPWLKERSIAIKVVRVLDIWHWDLLVRKRWFQISCQGGNGTRNDWHSCFIPSDRDLLSSSYFCTDIFDARKLYCNAWSQIPGERIKNSHIIRSSCSE